jgi:hypothetical protein
VRARSKVEEVVYRTYQDAWSAWACRRYRDELDCVAAFCLFVGYPRSGHSIVGALLNAHRHAVVSHELGAQQLIVDGRTREELYSRILARAHWFDLRGNTSNYPYAVPGQWQGRFESLRLVGDKRGGAVTRCLAEHPDFLERARALVGVPLRLLHVVRNPFDNIASISIWNRLALEQSADYYFRHCATTSTLDALSPPGEVVTVRHEELIRDPAAVLSGLCAFLGLELYPGYLDDCCSVVFPSPSFTRLRLDWPPAVVREVERRARSYPFLDGYAFETEDGRSPLAH